MAFWTSPTWLFVKSLLYLWRDLSIGICVNGILTGTLETFAPKVNEYWLPIVGVYLVGQAAQILFFSKEASAADAAAKDAKQKEEDTGSQTWMAFLSDWAIGIVYFITFDKFMRWSSQNGGIFFGGWFAYKIVHLTIYYVKKYRKKSEEPDLKDSKVNKEFKAKAALRNAVLSRVEDTMKDTGGIKDPHLPTGIAKGQKWSQNNFWPIIDIRVAPFVFELNDDYRLEVEGLGEDGAGKMQLSLKDLEALGVQTFGDQIFHCVTASSVRDLHFRGIPLQKFIDKVNPPKDWVSMMSFGRDGYSTNVPRDECEVKGLAEPFIAIGQVDQATGEEVPIPYEHGVIRIMFPQLYGWKGSKWMNKVRFDKTRKLGFWERSVGAHFRGRIDLEERFSTSVFLGDAAKNETDMESRDILMTLMMLGSGPLFRLAPFRSSAVFGQRCLGMYARMKLYFIDTSYWWYDKMGWKVAEE